MNYKLFLILLLSIIILTSLINNKEGFDKSYEYGFFNIPIFTIKIKDDSKDSNNKSNDIKIDDYELTLKKD